MLDTSAGLTSLSDGETLLNSAICCNHIASVAAHHRQHCMSTSTLLQEQIPLSLRDFHTVVFIICPEMGWLHGPGFKKKFTVQSIPEYPCECCLLVPNIPSSSLSGLTPTTTIRLHSRTRAAKRGEVKQCFEQWDTLLVRLERTEQMSVLRDSF